MDVDKTMLIKDLFGDDFFEKFKVFLFSETLEEFLEKCIVRKSKFDNTMNVIDIIKRDYSNIVINNYDDFVNVFVQNKIFQFDIEVHILDLKYLLKKINGLNIKTNYYNLNLDINFIYDFYDNEIIEILNNTQLKKLFDEFYDNNPFIIFNNFDNINQLKCEILIQIISYVCTYIKIFITDFSKDINDFYNIYKLEARLILNKVKNSESKLTDEIQNRCKQLRSQKYNQKTGRKAKEHSNVNKVNIDELVKFIKDAKDIIKEHKKDIELICKENDKKKAKIMFSQYVNDLPHFSKIYLETYFENNLGYKNNTPVELVAYKCMNDMFALDFFDDDVDDYTAYDNMKKYINRSLKKISAGKGIDIYDKDFKDAIDLYTNVTFGEDMLNHLKTISYE